MKRILPVSFWGCIIWFLSELLFGFIFMMEEMRELFIAIYLLMLPVCLITFFFSYYEARRGNNRNSLLLLVCFCLCSGILGVPLLLMSGKFNVFIYGALSLGFGGVMIVYITAIILNENFLSRGSFWFHLIIVLLLFILFEVTLIALLEITSIFTILLSIVMTSFIILVTLLYGAYLAKRIKRDYWMMWALQILGTLVLTWIMLVIVIIVILAMIAGDFDGDAPDVFYIGGGSSSSRKERKQKKFEKTTYFERMIAKRDSKLKKRKEWKEKRKLNRQEKAHTLLHDELEWPDSPDLTPHSTDVKSKKKRQYSKLDKYESEGKHSLLDD